jgi:DNA topoisomerase-1
MRCAQILYEVGLISYMRTDSNFLSEDAIQASKSVVLGNFGSTYLNEDSGNEHTRRKKKGKQGNKLAQEAHEAIRPSIQSDGSFISTRDVATHYTRESNGYTMTDSLFKLYQLIYERTVAYFMKNQIMEQTTVLVDCVTKDDLLTLTFRASGRVVIFDGYTKLTSHTVETSSDNTEADRQPSRNFSKLLPSGLEKGKELQCREAVGKSHTTKPPPRYSEASFVKDLETLGVGRPSTYASIVQTLKSRFYVGSSSGNTSRRSGSSIRGSAISASRAAGGSGNISIHDNLIYKAEFFSDTLFVRTIDFRNRSRCVGKWTLGPFSISLCRLLIVGKILSNLCGSHIYSKDGGTLGSHC